MTQISSETMEEIKQIASKYKLVALYGKVGSIGDTDKFPIILHQSSPEICGNITVEVLKGRNARRGPAESS